MTAENRKIVENCLVSKYGKEGRKYEAAIFKMCGEEEDGYLEQAYEKLGELMFLPEKRPDILKDIAGKVVGWDSCAFTKYREKELSMTRLAQVKPEVKEGKFRCRTCKGNKFYYDTPQQTRSGDEGMTSYVICVKCGTRKKLD